MNLDFAESWKPLAARALVALAFGAVALAWPGPTFAGLVMVFGAYALVDGLLALLAARRQRTQRHSWLLATEGFFGVGLGLAALVFTKTTTLVLMDIVALWALATGALEILAAALAHRMRMPGAVWLLLAGIVSVALGLLTVQWPQATAAVLVMLLGVYALLFGGFLLALAVRIRRVASPPRHDASATADATS